MLGGYDRQVSFHNKDIYRVTDRGVSADEISVG